MIEMLLDLAKEVEKEIGAMNWHVETVSRTVNRREKRSSGPDDVFEWELPGVDRKSVSVKVSDSHTLRVFWVDRNGKEQADRIALSYFAESVEAKLADGLLTVTVKRPSKRLDANVEVPVK